MSSRTGCLICGAPLHYFQQERELECALCHRKFPANASCEAGHFVCDECHARRGLEVIREACGKSTSRNPITLMQEIMGNPFLYMHGPEHHVLVGAALLTAYRNCGGELDLPQALSAMEERGKPDPRRGLRLLRLLRRGGVHGHLRQHRHRRHPAGGGELGPGQLHDRQGPGAHRRPGRSPVLQAGLLHRHPGRRGVCPGAPGGDHGGAGGSGVHLLPGKCPVPGPPVPLQPGHIISNRDSKYSFFLLYLSFPGAYNSLRFGVDADADP